MDTTRWSFGEIGLALAGAVFITLFIASSANAQSWQSVGGGFSGFGDFTGGGPLVVYNGDLIAGGVFTMAGEQPANFIAKWDGSVWHPLGTGTNDGVTALTVFNGDLIVGGAFDTAGGMPATRIARWDGNSWHPLGSLPSVHSLAVYNGELVAGVSAIFGDPGVRRWTGTTWQPLGNGPSNSVHALAVWGDHLIAGGQFTHAGGQLVNSIALWDGDSWQSVGGGVSEGQIGLYGTYVWALAEYGDTLVVGGIFEKAGMQPANHVAQWDGSSWETLAGGVAYGASNLDSVTALRSVGSDLIVGGLFDSAGGEPANHVARWTGESWFPLGKGTNHIVTAIAEYNGELVVSGPFTLADGNVVNHIARWTTDVPMHPADLDGNGVVNVFDLLILLAAWGPCDDCEDCPADLDDSCAVNVFDLLILLANWG